MRKLRTSIALAASLALAGCQTLDGVTVNGVDVNKKVEDAQGLGNLGNCSTLCWVAAAVVVGVGVWLIADDDD